MANYVTIIEKNIKESFTELAKIIVDQNTKIEKSLKIITENICNTKQTMIIKELENAKELIYKIIHKKEKAKEPIEEPEPNNKKMIIDIIEQLKEIIKTLHRNHYITIEDL